MPKSSAPNFKLSERQITRRSVLTRFLASTYSIAAPSFVKASEPLKVIYPPSNSPKDTRSTYYLELLDLVMRKSGVSFEMRPFENRMVGARVRTALENNQGITVCWFGRQKELDEKLLPLRVDLGCGVLGSRLLLIRASDRERFGLIRNLGHLQKYLAGQHRDWVDTQILRANGLPVEPTALYSGMFAMLAAGRFDYFPRDIMEIWTEEQQHANLDIIIEPTLALRYPYQTAFYVSRRNPALAEALDRGLHVAKDDGAMAELFERHHRKALRRARLDERTTFELRIPAHSII